jgi:4-hydroxy-tetrahydrodipicolinate synthase
MPLVAPFCGIVPAIPIPLKENLRVDGAALSVFARSLIARPGITGLVTNGHTGEVFALSREERAEVTRIVAEAVEGRVPVISGICAEGQEEVALHAEDAREAGASGLLVMPPHYWLRFGMEPEHVLEHFRAVGEAARINLVVHIYPAWTKASYSSDLLAELARLEWVTTFKIGTREMSKYDRDLRAIRTANPNATILTCHDEYLLASMVQGVDGALVGFASLLPDWIVELHASVCRGDLRAAQQWQERIYRLKAVIYASGEPTVDAHARLKAALWVAGVFPSARMRPPVKTPSGAALDRIREAVESAGLAALYSGQR